RCRIALRIRNLQFDGSAFIVVGKICYGTHSVFVYMQLFVHSSLLIVTVNNLPMNLSVGLYVTCCQYPAVIIVPAYMHPLDLKQYPRKYNIRAEIIKEDGLKEGDLLTYDEHNNWIKRVRFKGEKPETIYVREIEYIENRSSLSGLLLNGKVKTVKQVSYIANPKPDGSILRGKKKGHFFDYTFDEEGYAKSENSYNEVGEPTGRVEFEYNEEKQIVKESYKQPDGKLLHTIEWNYTPEGNVKSKVMKDSQGEGLRKALYYYNLEYDCIKEVWYNRDGTIYHEVKSQYDAYGKCVFQEVTVSQQEDERCSTVMKWNFQGRKVEEKIYLPSGEEKASFTYRYSRTGECISGTEKEGAGDPVKILYKFYRDKANNWKMRIKHVDGVPTVYEERMYTYYN
ncbi:hypothetical protein LJB79_01165, partial [Bacteroides sp. OttesenSCG-928-M17]|nr:hypothetical protein [Bacteroides sp. OttesenSCG-928-M17]